MDNEMTHLWQKLRHDQPSLGSLLHGLDDDALSRLASLSRPETFDAGTCVFKDGSPGDSMYLVASGQFQVTKADIMGTEVELRVIEPGEVFGEIALLEPVNRTATVTATSPSTTFRLERAELDSHPELAARIYANLARILARRLTKTTDDVLFLETWIRLTENEVS